MAEQVQVRKGTNTQPGAGEQLPQGAATQVNESNAAAAQAVAQAEGQAQQAPQGDPMQEIIPSDVEFVSAPQGRTYTPQDEDEEILFADATGRSLPSRRASAGDRLPAQIVRYMPMMAELAADPAAPPALKIIYRALVARLEEELRS